MDVGDDGEAEAEGPQCGNLLHTWDPVGGLEAMVDSIPSSLCPRRMIQVARDRMRVAYPLMSEEGWEWLDWKQGEHASLGRVAELLGVCVKSGLAVSGGVLRTEIFERSIKALAGLGRRDILAGRIDRKAPFQRAVRAYIVPLRIMEQLEDCHIAASMVGPLEVLGRATEDGSSFRVERWVFPVVKEGSMVLRSTFYFLEWLPNARLFRLWDSEAKASESWEPDRVAKAKSAWKFWSCILTQLHKPPSFDFSHVRMEVVTGLYCVRPGAPDYLRGLAALAGVMHAAAGGLVLSKGEACDTRFLERFRLVLASRLLFVRNIWGETVLACSREGADEGLRRGEGAPLQDDSLGDARDEFHSGAPECEGPGDAAAVNVSARVAPSECSHSANPSGRGTEIGRKADLSDSSMEISDEEGNAGGRGQGDPRPGTRLGEWLRSRAAGLCGARFDPTHGLCVLCAAGRGATVWCGQQHLMMVCPESTLVAIRTEMRSVVEGLFRKFMSEHDVPLLFLPNARPAPVDRETQCRWPILFHMNGFLLPWCPEREGLLPGGRESFEVVHEMGHRAVIPSDVKAFLRRRTLRSSSVTDDSAIDAVLREVIAVICVYSAMLQKAYFSRVERVDRILAGGLSDPQAKSGVTKCTVCGKSLPWQSRPSLKCMVCRREEHVQTCVATLRDVGLIEQHDVEDVSARLEAWVGPDVPMTHDRVASKLVALGHSFTTEVICISLSILGVWHVDEEKDSECVRRRKAHSADWTPCLTSTALCAGQRRYWT